MRPYALIRSLVILATALSTVACATGDGEVVKVTALQTGQLSTLKEEDRAKIEEIKKTRGQEALALDPSLSTVLEETPHFNITEYLRKHPEVSGQAGQDYRVGGYDVLSITVYEEKDLSREAVRVSADGYVSFPLIGRAKVDGLTTAEIEKLISAKLAEGKYLLDAHVSVMVTEYKSKKYLVLGSVKNPASYALQAQERVLDAISKAGGLEFQKTGKKGMIIRTENPNTANERKIVINFDLMSLLKDRAIRKYSPRKARISRASNATAPVCAQKARNRERLLQALTPVAVTDAQRPRATGTAHEFKTEPARSPKGDAERGVISKPVSQNPWPRAT